MFTAATEAPSARISSATRAALNDDTTRSTSPSATHQSQARSACVFANVRTAVASETEKDTGGEGGSPHSGHSPRAGRPRRLYPQTWQLGPCSASDVSARPTPSDSITDASMRRPFLP